MNMVRHASNTITFTISTARDGCHIGVQRGTDRRIENRNPVFGAENDMNEDKCKRLGHGHAECGLNSRHQLQARTFVNN
jgi:hypothetical protein